MNFLARKATEWLIVNEAIDSADRELYEYAIYSMMITVAPLVLVLIIGLGMGALGEGLILILPFMLVRKFSGGYHAKSAGICMVSSVLILILCIYLALCVGYNVGITILMILSVLSLAHNSPIDSENRRLEADEITQYKKVTIVISVVCILVHILLVLFGLKRYAVCIAIGVLLPACLQLPCIVQKLCRKK